MAAEHRRMREFYEMDDLYPERLKLKELGADVEQWQKEVLANENAEGYADPTAYNAIKKVSAEGHEALDAKVNTLIKVLKFIIAESGFELVARIELRDRKTGRFFR